MTARPRLLAERDADVVLPGHGEPRRSGSAAAVAATLRARAQ